MSFSKTALSRSPEEQTLPESPVPTPRAARLFIAIPLPAATTSDIVAEVHRLQSSSRKPEASGSTRWSAPDSWHITLQFLGRTTPQQYECVTARLRALHPSPVSIAFGAIGTFDRVGVLFVDVRVSPQLLALQQAVTAATTPCGFVPEQRPYHPHITLARRKGKSRGEELRNLKLQIGRQPDLTGFTADSFVLYESIPTPEGSRYEIRERFLLGSRK
jgi:2'-5' RNA ligase